MLLPLAVRLEQYTWTTELLGITSFLRSLTNRTRSLMSKCVLAMQNSYRWAGLKLQTIWKYHRTLEETECHLWSKIVAGCLEESSHT